MAILHYTEEVSTPFTESFLESIAQETLKHCDVAHISEKVVSLNAIAVSSEKIRELNKAYRGKDAVTDVLSFGEYVDTEAVAQSKEKEIFLGELFFCKDFIEKAAAEDTVTLEHEMAYIFSHGILHLLGYDHSEKMFAIQDTVTEKIVAQIKK